MQLKTERIPIMCEKRLVDRIDDYSYTHRIRTRAEAIRQLIKAGLNNGKPETKKGGEAVA